MEIIQYRKGKYSEYVKINGIKYETNILCNNILRKNLPYIIEVNIDTKDYYLLDRDYSYMGYDNIKSLTELNENYNNFERIYLYNDGCKPWNGKKFMLDYINKYKSEKTKLKNCKNTNIINMFDWFDI